MSESCSNSKMNGQLHAYELGMLLGEEKDEFEAHLLECEFCFEHIKEFMPRGAILAASPEIKKLLATEHEEDKQEGAWWQKVWEMFWPKDVPTLLRPAVLVGILVLMLYPAYVGIIGGQRGEVSSVAEIGLLQMRAKQTYTIEPNRTVVLSFVCPANEANQTYSVVLTNPGGEIIYKDEGYRGADEFRVGRLLLPDHAVSPGEYVLKVHPIDGAQGDATVFEYVFEIEYHGAGR